MTDMSNILKQAGLEVEDNFTVENSGASYYVHAPGRYQGLIEDFNIAYQDAEGKKRDKDKNKITKDYPGAKPSHGNLNIIILKDPSGVIVGNDLSLPDDEPYGKFLWNQYIPIESDRQWQNVGLFSEFKLKTENGEEIAIVEGDKGSEKVHLSYFAAFKGIPVEFEIKEGKKKDSRFLSEITIKDNSFSKDLLAKRVKRLEILRGHLDAKLEAQRKNKDSESSDPTTDVGDTDAIMNEFGL